MNLSLVQVESSDKLLLPALLYRPDTKHKKAAIWLHGMGDNGSFYSPARLNALGEHLAHAGYGLLALNNRGAHNVKSIRINDESLDEKDQKYKGGTFYELIDDCVHDISGAADYLISNGYSELVLIGHSTGANKICVYDHKTGGKNRFARYIMLGPGDDTGLWYESLGPKKYSRLLKRAKAEIQKGNSIKTVPKYLYPQPFSWQSIHDILDPNGPYNTFPFYEYTHGHLGSKKLFKEFTSIQKPLLIVIGDQDEYMTTAGGPEQALNILKEQNDSADIVLLSDSDHGFHKQEEALAQAISSWLCSEKPTK